MRTFEKGNWTDGVVCPICNTGTAGEVILVGIADTQDGNNIRAIQVHLECIGKHIMYYPNITAFVIQQHKDYAYEWE